MPPKNTRKEDISLSVEQQASIQDLLRTRGDTADLYDESTTDEKSFLRNVAAAHDELQRLGFSTAQAELALRECGTTKRDALLDWLVLELPTDELPVSFRGLHRSEAGPTGNLQVIAPTGRSTAAAAEAAAENTPAEATPALSPEEEAAAAEQAAALAAKEEAEAKAAAEKAAEAQRQWILKYAQKTTQEEADREAAAAAAAAAGRASENAAEAERADRFALSLKNPAKRLAALTSRLKQAEGEAARLAALCGNSSNSSSGSSQATGGAQKAPPSNKAKKLGIEWGEGSQAAQLDGRAAAAAAARRVNELQKHVSAATTQVKRAASREQSERARLAQVQAVRAAAAAAAAAAAPTESGRGEGATPNVGAPGLSSSATAVAASSEGKSGGSDLDRHEEGEQEDEEDEEGDMFGALSNTLAQDPLESSSRVSGRRSSSDVASAQPFSGGGAAAAVSPPGPRVEKCKHPKCFFLRPMNPPKYATAADKAYCCIACKAAKKADDDPSHGPACERRLVGDDGDLSGSASTEAQAHGNNGSSGGGTGASGASAAKPTPAATWSGKTPKELLEEWCRKNSRPPPLFSQPLGGGATHRKGDGGGRWTCTVRPAGAAHAPKNKKGRGSNKPQSKAAAAAAASAAATAALAAATAAAAEAAAAGSSGSGGETGEAWAPPKPSEAVVVEYDVATEGDLLDGGTALYAAATKALYRFDWNKPMHVLLAPPYAALWKDWAAADAARADAAATQAKEAKDQAIARLAQDMRAARAPTQSQPPQPPPVVHQTQTQTQTVATATLEEASKSGTSNSHTVKPETEIEDDREVPDAWDASDDDDAEDDKGAKIITAPTTITAAAAADKSSADVATTNDTAGGVLESWEDLASDDDDDNEATAASALESVSKSDGNTKAAATTDTAPGGSDGSKTSTATTTSAVATTAREARAHGQGLKQMWLAREATPQWQAMARERSTLPMHKHRTEVIDTCGLAKGLLASDANNGAGARVAMLCGATGCGKSTQLGQFILEDAYKRGLGASTNIIVTQPRRVAATSLAERVSVEMAEPNGVGGLVGYAVRGDTRTSSATRLLFCTVGVLLRRLHDDPSLAGVSHVVVDETHERQAQGDFLLTALRELVEGSRANTNFTVVLMSATLDAALFRDYFGGPSVCPCVEVQGRTHPVANYYLDDLLMATGYVVEENSRHALKPHARSSSSGGGSSGGGSSGGRADVRVTGPGGRQRVEKIEWNAQDVHSSSCSGGGYGGGGEGDDARNSMASRVEAVQRSMDRVDESVLNLELIEEVLILLCGPDRDRGGLLPPGAELYDPTQPNDDEGVGKAGRSRSGGRSEGSTSEDVRQEEEVGEMAPRSRNGAPSMRGKTVLVFLAGLGEIRQLMERLDASPLFGRQHQLQQQQQQQEQQWVANSGLGSGRFSNKGGSSSSQGSASWCPQKFLVLPLHSSLSPHDQRRVFEPTPHDTTKIVISTNIAETSVTIPGVVAVVDCGRVKERRHARGGFSNAKGSGSGSINNGRAPGAGAISASALAEDWCAAANCKQRAGRAGRTEPGIALRCFSRHTFERSMLAHATPELARVPLENLCLEIKAAKLDPRGSAAAFLGCAPEPPPPDAVESALAVLIDAGAVDCDPQALSSDAKGSQISGRSGSNSNGRMTSATMPLVKAWRRSDPYALLKQLRIPHGAAAVSSSVVAAERQRPSRTGTARIDDSRLVLTPLGKLIAKLPVDVKLGKTLVLAAILGCLDPVATAVAVLSSKSPFSVAAGRAGADAADAARRPLRQPQSDFLTVVAAFEAMEAFGRNSNTGKSSNSNYSSSSSGTMSISSTSTVRPGLRWNGDQDETQDGGRRQQQGQGGYAPSMTTASSAAREKMFCEKHFLSYSAMVEIRDLRRDFGNLLASAGLVGGGSGDKSTTEKNTRSNYRTSSSSSSDGDGSNGVSGCDEDGNQEQSETAAASTTATKDKTPAGGPFLNSLFDDATLVGGSSANKHRLNRNLVAAVLAAGLYPHLAVSRPSSSSSGAPLEWRCGRRGDGVTSAASAGSGGAGAAEAHPGRGGRSGGEGTWGGQQGDYQIEGERVEVHRDSVNYGARTLTTKYLTFFEKRLAPGGGYGGSGRMQLMQTASVSPFAIVMFCNAGDVEVRHAEGIVVVDRWLPLRVPPKTAVLLRQLRQELERCLKAAAENPAQARSDPGTMKVVDAVAAMFKEEAQQAAPLPPPPKADTKTLV